MPVTKSENTAKITVSIVRKNTFSWIWSWTWHWRHHTTGQCQYELQILTVCCPVTCIRANTSGHPWQTPQRNPGFVHPFQWTFCALLVKRLRYHLCLTQWSNLWETRISIPWLNPFCLETKMFLDIDKSMVEDLSGTSGLDVSLVLMWLCGKLNQFQNCIDVHDWKPMEMMHVRKKKEKKWKKWLSFLNNVED